MIVLSFISNTLNTHHEVDLSGAGGGGLGGFIPRYANKVDFHVKLSRIHCTLSICFKLTTTVFDDRLNS